MQNLDTLVTFKIHGLKKDFAELRNNDTESVQQILYKISKDIDNLNNSTEEFKDGFDRLNSILNNQYREINGNANNLTKFVKKNTKIQSIMNQTISGILNQSSKLTVNITKLR